MNIDRNIIEYWAFLCENRGENGISRLPDDEQSDFLLTGKLPDGKMDGGYETALNNMRKAGIRFSETKVGGGIEIRVFEFPKSPGVDWEDWNDWQRERIKSFFSDLRKAAKKYGMSASYVNNYMFFANLKDEIETDGGKMKLTNGAVLVPFQTSRYFDEWLRDNALNYKHLLNTQRRLESKLNGAEGAEGAEEDFQLSPEEYY